MANPRTLLLAALLLSAAGCSYPVNPKLEHFEPLGGYRYSKHDDGPQEPPDAREETFVALSFSGGGTRAAAFSYGALEALRATDIGAGRTMLDEVDVVSSVSGGSFTAAYLAAFGQEAFFRDFPDAVLHRKLERGLLWRVLSPLNWPWLLSPYFGRGDLADEYYDDEIFRGRTFADLPERPFILLNATDIGRGAQFSFTQESFDRICSDLSPVSISRGVTASSAFPVAFTPLTVKNYGAESCKYERPGWMEGAEEDTDIPQRYDLFRTWASYEDAARRPYVHLSDGGLADNIGLRAIETAIFETDSWGMLSKISQGRVKHLVVIIVDAKPEAESSIDCSARPPGIETVLNAAATNPMENYSSDTIENFRAGFEHWDLDFTDWVNRGKGCADLAESVCEGRGDRPACVERVRDSCERELNAGENRRPPHPTLHLIYVRFEAIPDDDAKKQLKEVPTRLQLPPDQVEALRHWGRELVEDSDTYKDLVRLLRAENGT